MDSEWLTVSQLAEKLGVSVWTVYKWIRTGPLVMDTKRYGPIWLIRWNPFTASLFKTLKNGKPTPLASRRRGRLPGTKNRKPYPKEKHWRNVNKH